MGAINVTSQANSFVSNDNYLANAFLHDIRNYQTLSADEEYKLLKAYRFDGDMKAWDKLINSNQRFVYAVAKDYDTHDKLMDLVEEGNIGLMHAINEYDFDKKNAKGEPIRFLTYAVWFIRREIYTYLINKGLIIKKSNFAKIATKIGPLKNEFYQLNGRYPSEDELIELVETKGGCEVKDARDILDVNVMSIDSPFAGDDDETTFENSGVYNQATASYNTYNEVIETEHNNHMVDKLLSALKERDALIVRMSFGIGYDQPYSNNAIAEELNMTAERVRQIVNSATEKMKRFAVTAA